METNVKSALIFSLRGIYWLFLVELFADEVDGFDEQVLADFDWLKISVVFFATIVAEFPLLCVMLVNAGGWLADDEDSDDDDGG